MGLAGETITLVQAIGATLVMAGIFYVNRERLTSPLRVQPEKRIEKDWREK